MKKITMCLFSLVVAFAGSVVCAEGLHGGPAKGRKHMRQFDEVDKLLMKLEMQEKMQNRMDKKYHHKKMECPKESCPMMKRKDCDGPGMMKRRDCDGPGMMKRRDCDGAGKFSKDCKRGWHGRGMKSDDKKFAGKSSRHRKRDFFRSAMLKSYLLENYPEEMEKIVNLKKSNDKIENDILIKFKKLVDEAKAKMKADREKMKAEHQEFVKMLEEYKKTKDAKLAEKIKAKMSQFYDKRLEFMKKRIDKDAARVQKAYAGLKEKKASKDKEIAEKFEKITK
jgi:hypothetical protein